MNLSIAQAIAELPEYDMPEHMFHVFSNDYRMVEVYRNDDWSDFLVYLHDGGEWVEEEAAILYASDNLSAIRLARFIFEHGYAPEGSEHPFNMPF